MGDSSESAKGVGPYGLEPHGEEPHGQEPSASPRPAHPAREAPRAGDEPSPIKALDVCPNCGSPMGPVDTVVCMRCGFDLKTLKVIKTKTPPPATPPADQAKPEAETESAALSEPGAGDLWLPALLGAASLLLLATGCLAGFRGLVGGSAEESAGFFLRLGALVKIVLRVAILAGCGLGGLAVLAHIARARLGELKLAAVRMAGIMAILNVTAFISTTSRGLEWTIESIVQGLAYVGLTMFFFGLNLRDAVTLLGVTVFAMLGLTFASIILAPM
jgi:hypothetical protein